MTVSTCLEANIQESVDLLPLEKQALLVAMPNPKHCFTGEKDIPFTIGGLSSSNLKEVIDYSIQKNSLKKHSEVPEAIDGYTEGVLSIVFYFFGGQSSTRSVPWRRE